MIDNSIIGLVLFNLFKFMFLLGKLSTIIYLAHFYSDSL